jgi:dihydrofolate reductase
MNDVIGRDGGLPWHLSEDLKRFKRLTTGKPVIMGRVTHESIGKPLPDRTNIVISSRGGLEIAGCEVVASPVEALEIAAGAEEVMVIGGGKVYEQMLPLAGRIYLTRVHAQPDGDTFFPEIRSDEWRVVEKTDFRADENRPCGFSFVTMDRLV